MENIVIKFFNRHNIELFNKKVIVAVSTGVDSMVLLHVVNSLKAEYNLEVHIAHVNHRIRNQSDDEELFITNYANVNNNYIHIMHLEKNENTNFQSYARNKRYDFFKEIMEKVQGDYLLLAHHANDQMETVMMRILRGSNLRGYAGMNEVSYIEGYLVLRPLLNILKSELISYQKKHKIKYYEDSSNEERLYTRNRIRLDIIPSILKEEEKAHIKFIEFSNTLIGAADYIKEQVNLIVNSFKKGCDYYKFTTLEFLGYSKYMQEEILFTILSRYDLSKVNIEEVIKIINSNKKNLRIIFKDQFTIVKEYEDISIYLKVLENQEFSISVSEIGKYNINDTIEINVMKTDSVFIPSDNKIWYNSNMLPVIIRSRKPGDKLLIENGYKKVKDILIDLKMGILERDNILIMEKDNEVLAILGVRKSLVLKNIKDNDIVIEMKERKNG